MTTYIPLTFSNIWNVVKNKSTLKVKCGMKIMTERHIKGMEV
jgi:hypothetical protein